MNPELEESTMMKSQMVLPDETYFEKFVATLIAKEYETRILTDAGDEFVGYITGLDGKWLQITKSKDLKASLVRREGITEIVGTGDSLRDAPDEHQAKVRGWAFAIRKAAEEFLLVSRTPRE